VGCSFDAGIDIVNIVIGNPCGASGFWHFLAKEHKMVLLPWNFTRQQREVFVCLFGAQELWKQQCTAVKWQYL
jgi:hypothetical protein